MKRVRANQNVTANFAVIQSIITFSAGAHGSINGTKSQTVTYGGSTSKVTALPASCYRFMNWTGTNGFVTNNNPELVLSNVTTSQSVKANFGR